MSSKVKKLVLIGIGSIVLVGLIGSVTYSLLKLHKENLALKNNLNETQGKLSEAENQNTRLSQELLEASSTLGAFEGQISSISSTVGDLQKLHQIDSELLKKYSKVSFLNENYIPKGLTLIDGGFVYPKDKQLQFLSDAWPFLARLLNASVAAGQSLKVVSAYRSFGVQSGLKASYNVTYGAGTANQFSADQGYSEHQLGTALDFTTAKLGSSFTSFEKTPEFAWLMNNAYQYGFILSYPPHNTYYVYEPWHWRFVGVQLATLLHNENKHFYDLDQRQIDTYLLHLFD
jgi:LAS superfamily LD-carboxypeptidase LdcB